jgi:hypothetical protein
MENYVDIFVAALLSLIIVSGWIALLAELAL